MTVEFLSSPDAPMPSGGYAQFAKLTDCHELVFVSGQIPVDLDGSVPPQFEAQCRLVWSNVHKQLTAASMNFANIVKVTTFLGDRAHADQNSAIRREMLGDLTPALTVIIAQIYDPAWLLEIEVIAAK